MTFNDISGDYTLMRSIFKAAELTLLIFAAYKDIKEKKISIGYPIAAFIIAAVSVVYEKEAGDISITELIDPMIPGLMMIVLSFASKEGIGLGDGLMLAAMGPAFGLYEILAVLMISLVLSAVIGGVLMAFRKAGAKSTLAFLPFISVGAGVMCFAGL